MRKVLAAFAALLVSAAPSFAQNALEDRCAGDAMCMRMGNVAELAQVRTGIALAGGNPLAGASSTLGLRLGAIPRLSAAVRMTGVQFEDPNFSDRGTDQTTIARSLNIDASVGVFSGLSLFPTVGGFGSIDLLASYGKLSLPDDFLQEDVQSWAAGVRVGILRESFTAPGVSVSAMYRKIDDQQVGSIFSPQDGSGTYFTLSDSHVWSTRATVGKRVLMLGAVAGVGYDKFSSKATIANGTNFNYAEDDFSNDRTTLFGNVSWSMIILHLVGEAGVQRGGDENAYYGSLAVRLAL